MKLLRELINAFGISGNEDSVRRIISREIRKYVDEIKTDSMGNLIAIKKGHSPKVMVAAHMDEIGIMVRKITSDGKIKFAAVGGMESITLVGQRVHVATTKSEIHGVITSHKLQEGSEIEEIPGMDELYVDTGLNKKELQARGVKVGSYLTPEKKFEYLGSKEIISGKALDDRIGCCILIELAKKARKIREEIYFVFTVQEEMGLYGAKTSAYRVKPDWAVAVDVTTTDDAKGEKTKILGKGPCLTVMDAEMITNQCIDQWFAEVAKKEKIPLQLEVTEGGTTDAMSISLTRGGVPSTVLCVPIRNMHSTIGVAHKKDIDNATKLLLGVLTKPPKKCLF